MAYEIVKTYNSVGYSDKEWVGTIRRKDTAPQTEWGNVHRDYYLNHIAIVECCKCLP